MAELTEYDVDWKGIDEQRENALIRAKYGGDPKARLIGYNDAVILYSRPGDRVPVYTDIAFTALEFFFGQKFIYSVDDHDVFEIVFDIFKKAYTGGRLGNNRIEAMRELETKLEDVMENIKTNGGKGGELYDKFANLLKQVVGEIDKVA